MPWNILILPLISGYYLLSRCTYFKFKNQHLDRQRLIFDTVLAGIVILMITFLFRYLLEYFRPAPILFIYRFFPLEIPFVGTTFSSFILVVLLTELVNITFFKNKLKYKARAISEVGNELEVLLKHSVLNTGLLQFTLDSGKFYIGTVVELPTPSKANYTVILPMFSGYRDVEQKLIFTTDYFPVFLEDEEGSKDVALVIPIDRIVTASHFDLEMYERFNDKNS